MDYLIIAATNRPGSATLSVSKIVKERLLAQNIDAYIIDLQDLPVDALASVLYQKENLPEVFREFQQKIDRAQKIIFVVPEYNGSIPGVLKVWIDGLRYPDSLKDKKALLIGLSAGVQGNAPGLSHLTDILLYLGCHVFGGKTQMGSFYQHFKGGEIVFDVYNKILNHNLTKFIEH